MIWSIPGQTKSIFLTFDDGPVPELTPWILETLKKNQLKATFFCVGDNVRKYPELYERIINDGHSVGNHTYHHLNGWKTGVKEYISDVEKASEFIKSNIFRPPYGKMRTQQKKQLRKKYKIVMWDVLSKDYSSSLTKWKVLENVLNYARPGSIVVFHDNMKAKDKLQFVLPKVIEHYLYKAYVFKKIE
ncbi:polysaccharide deacetylase family protein [Bacteroidota bacterium]